MDLNLVKEAIDGSRRSLARTLSLIENGEINIEQIRQGLNIEGITSDSENWRNNEYEEEFKSMIDELEILTNS